MRYFEICNHGLLQQFHQTWEREPVGRSRSRRGGSVSSDMVILDLPPCNGVKMAVDTVQKRVRIPVLPQNHPKYSKISLVKGWQCQLTLGPFKVFIVYILFRENSASLDCVPGWKAIIHIYIYIFKFTYIYIHTHICKFQ